MGGRRFEVLALAAALSIPSVLSVVGCGGAASSNPPLPPSSADAGLGSGSPPVGGATTSIAPGDAGTDGGRRPLGDASTGPGFGQLFATIFSPTCSGGDCHNPGSRGGINVTTELTAYNSLVMEVSPGDSKGSPLYRILVSGEMPRGAPPLSSSELADIAAWIDRGAPND
jgi:hypothetical protein